MHIGTIRLEETSFEREFGWEIRGLLRCTPCTSDPLETLLSVALEAFDQIAEQHDIPCCERTTFQEHFEGELYCSYSGGGHD